MRCNDAANCLWEYLDDELGPEEARAVRRHLAGCPTCRARRRYDAALLACITRAAGAGPCMPSWLAAALCGLTSSD